MTNIKKKKKKKGIRNRTDRRASYPYEYVRIVISA